MHNGESLYPSVFNLHNFRILLNIPIIVFNTIIRYNSRMEANVFDEPDSIDKYIGDCFLPCCCLTAPCAGCQQLRAIPKSNWDCCGQLLDEGMGCIADDGFKCLRAPTPKTMPN